MSKSSKDQSSNKGNSTGNSSGGSKNTEKDVTQVFENPAQTSTRKDSSENKAERFVKE